MADKKECIESRETELQYITREIERLQVRRQSLETELPDRQNSRVVTVQNRAAQPKQQKVCRSKRHSVHQPRSREATLREQYSAKAIDKFVRVKECLLREYGQHSKSKRFHRPLLDARQEEILIGDFVRALTRGRNYTDRGVVSKFSKDGSRVYFIDNLGREQNRAPNNLAHVDD